MKTILPFDCYGVLTFKIVHICIVIIYTSIKVHFFMLCFIFALFLLCVHSHVDSPHDLTSKAPLQLQSLSCYLWLRPDCSFLDCALDKQEERVGVFYITPKKWMEPTQSLLYLWEPSLQTHTQGSWMASRQSQWVRSPKKNNTVLRSILADIDLTSKWDLSTIWLQKIRKVINIYLFFFFLHS